MDANRKRRLLAALEGQLERWRRARDDKQGRRRVQVLLQELQRGPQLPGDDGFPRRVASRLARVSTTTNAMEFSASLTLARMDCLLWQVSLANSRPSSAVAA